MSWCSRCGDVDVGRLYARIGKDTSLCFDCWVAMGRPWPVRQDLSKAKQHEHEEDIRRRMLRRGGNAAYMVKKGGA